MALVKKLKLLSNPGKSQTTTSLIFCTFFGTIVVFRGPVFSFDPRSVLRSEDFPTLVKPTKPLCISPLYL